MLNRAWLAKGSISSIFGGDDGVLRRLRTLAPPFFLLILTACASSPAPETATPQLPAVERARESTATPSLPPPTATADVTQLLRHLLAPAPPTLDRPLLACEANARSVRLDLPVDPIRISDRQGDLLLLAGGALFTLPLDTPIIEKMSRPRSLMPPQNRVGRYTVQELVDMAPDPLSGDLYLLDKSGDIYRYDAAGVWSMAVPVAPVAYQTPDPQYLALDALAGSFYALDSDLRRVWVFKDNAQTPVAAYRNPAVESAFDLAFLPAEDGNTQLYLLTRNGAVQQFTAAGARASNVGDFSSAWPAQLSRDGDHLLLVDGAARSVVRIDPEDAAGGWQVHLRFQNMQRLRSATVEGATLFAVGGPDLYIVELHNSVAPCPEPVVDDGFTFHGFDLTGRLPALRLPAQSGRLPARPRSSPGARRLYRLGIHNGVDLYNGDVPALAAGSPVYSVAPGTVLRIDHDYTEMTPQEFEDAKAQSQAEHRTPVALLDRFRGRQVHVDHGNGVVSRYAHLRTVQPNLAVGDSVAAGDRLGTVGVSGSAGGVYGSDLGVHLHFEIWVEDRYLGQGWSVEETMRVWRALVGR